MEQVPATLAGILLFIIASVVLIDLSFAIVRGAEWNRKRQTKKRFNKGKCIRCGVVLICEGKCMAGLEVFYTFRCPSCGKKIYSVDYDIVKLWYTEVSAPMISFVFTKRVKSQE